MNELLEWMDYIEDTCQREEYTINSEMLLTILSSPAQEESRAISTNIKWSYARKIEKGES